MPGRANKWSHFPGGFGQGVTLRNLPVLNTHSGKVFWVDSVGGSDQYKGTFDRPFGTVDYAIGQCTADTGAVIMVKAGHAETVTSSILLDVAGVTIMGLGVGANRPTITGPAADECIDITADDCAVMNLRFAAVTSGTQAATRKITVTGTGASIRDCDFQCGASDDNAIYVEYTASQCEIVNNEFHVTADGPDTAIYLDGATGGTSLTNTVIRGNFFDGGTAANSWDEGVIYSSGVHIQTLVEGNNFLFMSGGVGGVEFTAAATGLLRENFFGGGTLGQMLDPGSCYCYANFEADAIDEKAREFPTSAAS